MSKWFLIFLLIAVATANSVKPRPAHKMAVSADEMEVEEDEDVLMEDENASVEQLASAESENDADDTVESFKNSETAPETEIVDPSVKIRTGRYTLHTSPLRTWSDATEYCHNDNQHLVRLETSLELRTVLTHFIPGVSQVWTDGIGDIAGKKYMWSTSGSKVDINELEMVREDEDVFLNALVLERKGLVGVSQKKLMPFICEQ